MPSERDIVAEARQLELITTPAVSAVLRLLANEVVCLRGLDGALDDIRECDKCDLCEDHHD